MCSPKLGGMTGIKAKTRGGGGHAPWPRFIYATDRIVTILCNRIIHVRQKLIQSLYQCTRAWQLCAIKHLCTKAQVVLVGVRKL